MEGNKMANDRHAPRQQPQPLLSSRSCATHKAANLVIHKQSQIDLIKRRISALSVREQKLNHKAVNNLSQLEHSLSVREQTQQIRQMLQKKREKEEAEIKELRNVNLKTRMEQYSLIKLKRSEQQAQKSENSQLIRSKSRDISTTIQKEREKRLEQKRQQQMKVHQQQLLAREEKAKHQLRRIESVKSHRQQEEQYLSKLSRIKDRQLTQLGQLELTMVEKTNNSKRTYEISRERLKTKSLQEQ